MIPDIGKKIGMSQVFDDNGKAEAITVIEADHVPLLRLKHLPKKAMNQYNSVLATLKS